MFLVNDGKLPNTKKKKHFKITFYKRIMYTAIPYKPLLPVLHTRKFNKTISMAYFILPVEKSMQHSNILDIPHPELHIFSGSTCVSLLGS